MTELSRAENENRAKNHQITTLIEQIAGQSTEIANLKDRITVQEQQAAKDLAKKDAECAYSKQKWYRLEQDHIALEKKIEDIEQEYEMEITDIRRTNENEARKADRVLERESNRKKEEVASYKKKLADSESKLQNQAADLKGANAALFELRKEGWKSQQDYNRLQKEKTGLEGRILNSNSVASAAWKQVTELRTQNRDQGNEILEVRQQNSLLRGKVDRFVNVYSVIRTSAKAIDASLEIVETDISHSSSAYQEQLRGERL